MTPCSVVTVEGDLDAFPDALDLSPFEIPLHLRGLFVHVASDDAAGRSADRRPDDRPENRVPGGMADHSADDGAADHGAARGLVPGRAIDGGHQEDRPHRYY